MAKKSKPNGASLITKLVDKASGETVCEIFGPPRADSDDADGLSQGLYALSEIIIRGDVAESGGGGLGGRFGYGANYENDVFKMHPYCWCELPDCPWCAGCWCYENCVSDYGRSVEPGKEPYPKGQECPWCSNEHRWADKGALSPRDEPHDGAPHFWHKSSGLRVWWYKSIGRDMKTNRPDLTGKEWARIYSECVDSLPAGALEKARAEHEHENTPEYKAEEARMMHAMFEAVQAVHEAMRPCYECSNVKGWAMVGGSTTTCGKLKIVEVSLDADGACTNCGHVTTDAENAILAKRREKMNKSMRKRFADA